MIVSMIVVMMKTAIVLFIPLLLNPKSQCTIALRLSRKPAHKKQKPDQYETIGPEYVQFRVASLGSVRRNKPVDSPVARSHSDRNLSIAIEPCVLLGAGLN
jgi:hypothetical protein